MQNISSYFTQIENKKFWIYAIPIWLISLSVLILALTNVYTNNPFTDYKLVVGISFITITGVLKRIYRNLNKANK